jgi:hypothetical protein
MPTVQVKAELSADDLFQAAEQMEASELHQFVTRLLVLRAQRQAACLSQPEAELLRQINQGLPEPVRERYQGLIDKRQAQTLTSEEHAELLQLTDQAELLEARRAEALVQLAQLRKVPLDTLMKGLGIPVPADD